MSRKDIYIIVGIVSTLIISRIIPHAPNFTSSLAGMIFAGAMYRKFNFALILLVGYFIADILINNIYYATDHNNFQWTSQAFVWIYASLLLSFFIGKFLAQKSDSPLQFISSSIISSLAFFLLSNFGVWTENLLYPMNIAGLITCYAAALPFIMNEIASSIFFVSVFYFMHYRITESKLVFVN